MLPGSGARIETNKQLRRHPVPENRPTQKGALLFTRFYAYNSLSNYVPRKKKLIVSF